MRLIALIVFLAFLSGCTTFKNAICYDSVIPAPKQIPLDSTVFQECRPLKIPEAPLTYEGILINTKDNTIIYLECKEKYNNAIVLLRKLSNNPKD